MPHIFIIARFHKGRQRSAQLRPVSAEKYRFRVHRLLSTVFTAILLQPCAVRLKRGASNRSNPRASYLSAAWPLKTDDEQGEIAVSQGRCTSVTEELLDFAGLGGADHGQLDRRGLLSEVVDERAVQTNRADFDLRVVVHAMLEIRITGCGILVLFTGRRLRCCQHSQGSVSPQCLVERQLQNIDAIW